MAGTSVAHSWPSPIPAIYPKSSHKVIALKVSALPITNHLSKIEIFDQICTSKSGSNLPRLRPLYATLRSPKGFGSPKKKKKTKKDDIDDDDDDDDEEEEDEKEEGVIPEIVTNRMMNRMGFTVGVPFLIGLSFFPFFYYLKVVLKVDVPSWLPIIVSFMCLGTALAGVSYGIVSASWDPMREGSFWGWNEALRNWPVFWQSFWGAGSKKK